MFYLFGLYLLFALTRFVYQIVVGFFYVNPALSFDRSYQPLVSVIVPAWNEAVGIEKTVRSVLRSNYKNIEILVIDDGSKDGTSQSVVELQKKLVRAGRMVTLVKQRNKGKAAALNNGIRKSSGEIIITIDADSYITKNSIRELVRTLSNQEYDAAIGEIVIGNSKSTIGKIQKFEYLTGFHFRRSQHILDSIYIFPGALTAFRRKILKKVGNFEVGGITEDLDMSMKIRAMGYKVAYVDSAVCITEGASTFNGLLNQRIRWRHGFLDSLFKRKDFVWSSNKGKYLTFIEFPLSIIGLLEILMYPLILIFLITLLLGTQNLIVLIVSYSFLPFILLLLNDLNGGNEKASLRNLFLFPITMGLVNIIEFIALIISAWRLAIGQQTGWTVWNRTGADA